MAREFPEGQSVKKLLGGAQEVECLLYCPRPADILPAPSALNRRTPFAGAVRAARANTAMSVEGHDAIHPQQGIVHPDFRDAYALMNAEVHELVKSVQVRIFVAVGEVVVFMRAACAIPSALTPRWSSLRLSPPRLLSLLSV